MVKRIAALKRNLNINVKVTAEERDLFHKQAKKYADGSVSAWVRYAAIRLVPPKSELKD